MLHMLVDWLEAAGSPWIQHLPPASQCMRPSNQCRHQRLRRHHSKEDSGAAPSALQQSWLGVIAGREYCWMDQVGCKTHTHMSHRVGSLVETCQNCTGMAKTQTTSQLKPQSVLSETKPDNCTRQRSKDHGGTATKAVQQSWLAAIAGQGG
jgi:hypothetical protein